MLNKIELANKEILKVINYIEDNKDMFNSMNLKLYKAINVDLDEFPLLDKDGKYFWDWVESEYYFFEETLKLEYNITFMDYHYQLGRTSSFYLHDGNIIDKDYDCTIYNIINNYYGNIELDFNGGEICKDTIINMLSNENIDYSEDIHNELDYIIEDMYNDFIGYVEPMKIIYDIIKNFKNNQVENFKSYLQYEQEQAQQEQDELRQEQEKQEVLRLGIINKYNISNNDISIIKEVF